MLQLRITTDTGVHTVDVWTENWTQFYGFVPGNAALDQVELLPAENTELLFRGEALPVFCGDLEWNNPYPLNWSHGGSQYSGELILLPSGGVSVMYLNTQSGTMDYIHEEKGNAERGSLKLYDASGRLNYSGSVSSLRGRGNSTWVVHEKKPYGLELTQSADLLGMGTSKKWVLLADALDHSAMRNKIVYDFAKEAGLPYTPDAQWTEVYLNGQYAGLYLLCERVEVDPQRVDLSPDGSLICMDRDIRVEEDTDPYFVTDSGQYLQICQSSDIGSLKTKIQAMEHALLSEDESLWQTYIDQESWVKKYLIEEIFGSYDAGFQSQYFFLHNNAADSKVYAGPVWDYDASIGNTLIWALNSPEGLYAWRPEAMEGYNTLWLHSLYNKESFRTVLAETYRQTFRPLLEILLHERAKGYADQIGMAFERNRIRWNVDTEGVQAESEYIIDYLSRRMGFLSELWLEEKEFCILRLKEGWGGYQAYYAVEPGTCFSYLPDIQGEGFLGWHWEGSDLPFDPEMPITEDGALYPKWSYVWEEYEAPRSIRDVFLDIYFYVPAVVLILMGMIAVVVSVRLHRKKKKTAKEHSYMG